MSQVTNHASRTCQDKTCEKIVQSIAVMAIAAKTASELSVKHLTSSEHLHDNASQEYGCSASLVIQIPFGLDMSRGYSHK